ncbi:hypothetical protein BXO88_02525 [Oribacterium sp. C9]|uniref:hypothetical protein n=1 Tax=Oribacterium sp. C9 TaxID=1943579 RepID=UPI00098ED168|nr:hypothetical protein [Oribacterium sp. C9]OON88062.1 hypothetical protein BXO88_02525 [Oribacterium sp. C9]
MKQYVVHGNTVRSVDIEELKTANSTVVIEQKGHRNQLHLYRTRTGQLQVEYAEDKSVIKPILRCIPAVIIDRICYTALVFSLVIIFFSSYQCVKLDTLVATRLSNIEQRRSELEDLKLQNGELKAAINSAINPDVIYQEATQLYGMVAPADSEVITFTRKETGYVRTWDDIPTDKVKEENIAVMLTNRIMKLFGK